MSIRRWHVGKLMILWAWGGTAAALVLIAFESSRVESRPWLHFYELMFVLVVAIVLSAITWIWLGNRKAEAESSKEKIDP